MRISLAKMVKGLLEASKPAAMHRSYEEAVRSLNQLQSNAAVLEKIRVERDARKNDNIPEMLVYLQRVGVQLDDVNKLNVIHITGTKGKGSTCAFCESILRSHGYKTGFYSSPHLIEVRERIRINGKPISPDAFSHYYWQCHELLLQGAGGNAAEMPSYFRFLTVMAFKVFVEEGVDAALVEVGIGGRYDSTNFVSKPVACGVTSLGLDHVSILGDTVEKIAWQKGGIFKAGAAAITVPDQPGDSEQVLRQCAAEVGIQLQIAPPLDQLCIFDDGVGIVPSLSLQGRVQLVNAALAVQLAQSWLNAVAGQRQCLAQLSGVAPCGVGSPATVSPTFQQFRSGVPLSPDFLEGLRRCHWPGRNHVVRCGRVTYYLDGAHTVESIRQCVEWFDERSTADSLPMADTCVRVLLFNSTGDRSVASLLEPLLRIGFDAAAFCPNLVSATGNSVDQTSRRVTPDYQLTKSAENRNVWVTLNRLQQSRGRSRSEGAVSADDCGAEGGGEAGELQPPDQDCGFADGTPRRSGSVRRRGSAGGGPVSASARPSWQTSQPACDRQTEDPHASALMFPCIATALHWISSTSRAGAGGGSSSGARLSVAAAAASASLPARLASAGHVQVLVTGSLHLVGGVLAALKHQVD